LLLVSCDKQDEAHVRRDDDAPASVTRSRHASREIEPDKPESLRALLETALKIESPAVREKALADVAWSAIEIDPKLAHEAFRQLPANCPEKIRLIQHYAMRLAEENVDEALAWAAALGTEEEIAAAKALIALTIAETDPRRAADLLSESGIAGREFDVALVQVIQRWAAQSPPDAAAWTVMFPPGAAREAGIRVITEQWLPLNAQAAFGWYDNLKDPQLRKEAARAMEGVILQQPKAVRDAWLQHATPVIQSELQAQLKPAIEDVGDNIPPDGE
jgi:hypothetical protein